MTPQEFDNILDPIVVRYYGSISSGRRSPTRNAKVGGSNNSRHVFNLARDVVLDDPTETIMLKINNKDTVISMADAFILECQRQGLIAINEGDHIHVQTK